MLSQVKLKSFPWHGQYEGDRLGAIFGAAWELVLFLVLLLMFQIRFFIMVQSKLEIWYNFWWRCCFSKLGAFFYRGDQKCYLQLLADRWKWTSGESITFLENLYILMTATTFPIYNPKRYTFLIFDLKDETHEYMNIWPEKVNQPSMFYPLVQIIMPRSNPFRCCIVYLGTFQDSKIGQVDPRKTFVQTWPEAWSISGFSRFLGCCTFQQMKQRKIFDRLLQSNNA